MALRVAHIIGGLGIGGAERHLVNLLNAMTCEYRAVICLGPKTSGLSFHQDLDPKIQQFSVRVRRRSLPLGILRLASVLRENRVNVVHTHMFGSTLYGALAAKLAGVPVVVTTEHGENPWKKAFDRWLECRIISPLVDVRFCVSAQILELRRMDGVPVDKLMLTANGTVVPRPPDDRRAPNPLPVLGAVGRFIPAKDFPLLIKTCAELRDRGYKLRVNIIGDGPEKGNIVKMIDKLDMSSVVHLPGFVTDVERWYERFDIYVSSSIREGQPVALLEAMAHGLPIVATDAGATAETVRDGECGLIVPCSDAIALADAIGRLLDDEKLRKTLARNAHTRVKQDFSVNTVAKFHMSIYQKLLANDHQMRCDFAP